MPKRTKAIKVSDKNKAWNKKAEPYKYKKNTREPNPIILIVTEGQTEKLYFEAFPVLTLNIETIDLEGQSKLKLIEITEEILKNTTDKKYDEVWCVFDMDVKQGKKEFADFDNAIIKGKEKGYKIAYSNDCFELWFYLHFNYTDQQNHRKFYYKELGKLWNCNYQKEGKKRDFCKENYSRLEGNQTNAISNAKRLYNNQKQLPFHKQNPVTTVYELVEFLNQHCRK